MPPESGLLLHCFVTARAAHQVRSDPKGVPRTLPPSLSTLVFVKHRRPAAAVLEPFARAKGGPPSRRDTNQRPGPDIAHRACLALRGGKLPLARRRVTDIAHHPSARARLPCDAPGDLARMPALPSPLPPSRLFHRSAHSRLCQLLGQGGYAVIPGSSWGSAGNDRRPFSAQGARRPESSRHARAAASSPRPDPDRSRPAGGQAQRARRATC